MPDDNYILGELENNSVRGQLLANIDHLQYIGCLNIWKMVKDGILKQNSTN